MVPVGDGRDLFEEDEGGAEDPAGEPPDKDVGALDIVPYGQDLFEDEGDVNVPVQVDGDDVTIVCVCATGQVRAVRNDAVRDVLVMVPVLPVVPDGGDGDGVCGGDGQVHDPVQDVGALETKR